MNPENKAQIQSNRRKIFELEILINSKKPKRKVLKEVMFDAEELEEEIAE